MWKRNPGERRLSGVWLRRARWGVVPVALLLTAPATLAVGSAKITVSPPVIHAAPAAYTVSVPTWLQCGSPGPSPVRITFPVSVGVPSAIPTSAVQVEGRASRGVTVSGHTVTVKMPTRPPLLCDVVYKGSLTVDFTTAAGLRNPARPGTYTLTLRQGGSTFAGSFHILLPVDPPPRPPRGPGFPICPLQTWGVPAPLQWCGGPIPVLPIKSPPLN